MRKYSKEKVSKLIREKSNIKSPHKEVSDEEYRRMIGRLRGAGHLQLKGSTTTKRSLNKDGGSTYSIEFESLGGPNGGEHPHFHGYLESPHPKDSQYKIRGWWNPETSSIRIELLDEYER